jgi:hypothetical protein
VSVQKETHVELTIISLSLQHTGDPALAFKPGGQDMQAVAPDTFENVPTGQS